VIKYRMFEYISEYAEDDLGNLTSPFQSLVK
jgi:hypothetical protein